jgi:ABC-2 type transport system ATP-binding protein
MEHALRMRGIRKTFGSATAVHELDLAVPTGALYGVIGPNGAGKTTTIRLIMSILFPDAGELSVLGHRSALEAKNRIGYLPEERGVYRKMRVGAFLTYMAQLKGVTAADLPARVTRGLERAGLGGTEKKRCEELSKGMLQKVQFLAAIIHQPDLLILDEPFSGLDPVSSRLLRDLVEDEHRRGATILLSTHVMTQAEELCEHVVMIHRGRKVLDDSVAAIRRRYDPRTIQFEPLDPAADLAPLRALTGVEHVEDVAAGSVRPGHPTTYDIRLSEGSDPGSAIRRITAAVTPARIELARPRLEDVFISLVSEGSAPAPSLIAGLRGESSGASA